METPIKITATQEANQKELKIYVPLPYGTNWQAETPVQETYTDSTGIYNIVDSRYQNDTLFLTLIPNLNAHSQFDALSSAINQLSNDDNSNEKPSQPASSLSLSDLLKVFLPTTSPSFVCFDSEEYFQLHTSIREYTFFVPTNNITILSPPPEA